MRAHRLFLCVALELSPGCAPQAPPADRCPDLEHSPDCHGACTGTGMTCLGYPGSGTGCVCVDGCLQQFWDGPCAPRRDVPLGDAGAEDAVIEHDAPALDAPVMLDAPTDVPVLGTVDAPAPPPDVPAVAGGPPSATHCVDMDSVGVSCTAGTAV